MLNSSRHRSLLTSSMTPSSTSRRVSCLGLISPRSATLLLALFGLLAHLQQFNYLGILHDTFPHVPKVRPTNSIEVVSSSIPSPSISGGGVNVVLDSEVTAPLTTPGIEATTTTTTNDIINTITNNDGTTSSSVWKDAAVARPILWFNLLPSKYLPAENNKGSASIPSSMTNTYVDQDWKAQQGDQEKDRKSWEAARTLTNVIRWYAALCALTCLCGVFGVVRSNLFCSRIFVLSSTLDLLWCALSLISLGIIVTYPNIRSLICEELSNTSTVILDLDQSSGHDLRASTGPVMLLGRAASTFWKRAVPEPSGINPADTLSSTYWWDSLLDNVLENENCEDVLESVLIPLGLVACLIYLALRIHFLIVIRHFYVSLLREQMSYHLTNHLGNGPTAHPNERKYSSSSASSSTSTSDFASCLPSSHSKSLLRYDDSKLVNEKMA